MVGAFDATAAPDERRFNPTFIVNPPVGSAAMPLQAAALLLVAFSPDEAVLLPACFAVGLLGVAPYALPPYVSLRVPAHEVGRATGRVARGLICNILLARVAAGLIADRAGCRAVDVAAAAVTALAAGVTARVVDGPAPRDRMGYGQLLRSLAAVAQGEPALRVAATCQFFGCGAFNVFWLGATLLLHGRFGWSPGAIGAVGLLGAASPWRRHSCPGSPSPASVALSWASRSRWWRSTCR